MQATSGIELENDRYLLQVEEEIFNDSNQEELAKKNKTTASCSNLSKVHISK